MSSTCKLWQGGTMHGYGQLPTGGLAHRDAYVKHKGDIPEGMVVRHTCDNRLCVNPEHLVLGTHKDNYEDAKSRNRHTHGTKSNHSSLTDEIMQVIKTSSERSAVLATRYKVSVAMIGRIKRGLAWRHV